MTASRLDRLVRGLVAAGLAGVLLAGCSLTVPPGSLSRDEAVAIAREASGWTTGEGEQAVAGTFEQLGDPGHPVLGPRPAPQDPVWRVSFGYDHGPLAAQGAVVLVDAGDGHVIQRWRWIA